MQEFVIFFANRKLIRNLGFHDKRKTLEIFEIGFSFLSNLQINHQLIDIFIFQKQMTRPFQKQNQQRQKRIFSLLNEPSPNFFIIHQNFLFPLHKQKMRVCGFFSKLEHKQVNFHIIEDHLDINSFIFILECIYGKRQRFPRNKDILGILDVAIRLDYRIVQQKICTDIANNFQDYGFFLILKIAYKLNLQWLKRRCFKEILIYDFEQIIINKVDLFDYDYISFIRTLRRYGMMKKSGTIKGLKATYIQELLKQYEKVHQISIDKAEILNYENQDEEFVKQLVDYKNQCNQKAQSQIVRKRSKTCDNPNVAECENCSKDKSMQSCSSISLKEQIQILNNINSELEAKNKNLIEEIKQVKSFITKRVRHDSYSTHDGDLIEQRINQMQKCWQQQQQKYTKIVQKIKTMNEHNSQQLELVNSPMLRPMLSLDVQFEIQIDL